MYRPKLSLSISTAAAQSSRPTLSIKSPGPISRAPLSPVPPPLSPAAKRFSSTLQVASYNYTNSCSSKSILKKQPATASTQKHIQFQRTPTVHCITPIENTDEYYGSYKKLSREERRWMVRE